VDPVDCVVVRGVALRRDPARELCFNISHLQSEMSRPNDTSSASRREYLHREVNQEVLSLEIAAQTMADFPEAPWELRMQLARQCWDETRHARLFFQRLVELGGYKGEFPIINNEWGVVCMLDSLPARLAVQNRTFEGGSLDVLRATINHWREIGDDRTAEVTETILADEVQHVRFANTWLKRLAKDNPRILLQVAAAIEHVKRVIAVLSPRPGDRTIDGVDLVNVDRSVRTNTDERRAAGFTEEEIEAVLRQES
jgi:uncharacterized ferritin-like protein (DUF455 family)